MDNSILQPLERNVRDKKKYKLLCEWILLGIQIIEAKSKEDIAGIDNDDMASYAYADFTWTVDFKEIDDINIIKERLIVHVVGKHIREIYFSEKSKRGPKGDRMKRFFDELTTEPQDTLDAEHIYGLSSNTIKNHRRFDTFSVRGLTKIKDGKIFRLPVDG